MKLAAGTRLGAYEILSPLGAGGMGEVWRATDTKLGRQVALKVLPEAFAEDAERMARFEREARVLASLNHPNIAHLYGLETAPVIPGEAAASRRSRGGTEPEGRVDDAPGKREPLRSHESPKYSGDPSTRRPDGRLAQDDSGDVTFLVMELVEGEDLSELIERGPIPIEEAIPIALQIAEALEAAHEAGIVHRDLKPANIKQRADGAVKVLDFGLAKAWDPETSGVDLARSPTLTQHATAADRKSVV